MTFVLAASGGEVLLRIVVQKYGGSSVADLERIRAGADRIAATRAPGAAVDAGCPPHPRSQQWDWGADGLLDPDGGRRRGGHDGRRGRHRPPVARS
jgi:hypothetical protein